MPWAEKSVRALQGRVSSRHTDASSAILHTPLLHLNRVVLTCFAPPQSAPASTLGWALPAFLLV